MTNPVILLGTQSNGETLPVQVDATGRLVAKGLKGDPGDPALGLPSYEGVPDGYILMIDQGEPAWMPDPNKPPIVWSEQARSLSGAWYSPSNMPQYGFDGNLENQCFATDNKGWGLVFPEPMEIGLIEIYSIYGRGQTQTYSLNGTSGDRDVMTDQWQPLMRLAGLTVEPGDQLTVQPRTPAQCSFTGIRINGEVLLDPVAEFKNKVKDALRSLLYEGVTTTDIDLT